MTYETPTAIPSFDDATAAPGPVSLGGPLHAIDVLGAYRLLLGRTPAASELQACMAAGLTLREFLAQIAGSKEFDACGGILPPHRILMSEVAGFRFWFNTSDREMGVPMALGRYEPQSAALLERVVRPGMHCLDVGAQTGFFTCLMATLAGPSGTVDAFEPMPDSYELLQRNIAENGWRNVRGHHVAASREPGVIEMSHVSHMYVAGRIDGAPVVDVPAVPIDDVIGGPVDVVKMDIEGHEPAAVMGMKRLIERWRPVLITECNEYWLQHCSGLSSSDYCRMLESLGYTLFDVRNLSSPIDAASVRLDVLETIDVVAVPRGRRI